MIVPPAVGSVLGGVWMLVGLKYVILSCLCAWALVPHFTYRVPGPLLSIVLPIVGVALGAVHVAIVVRHLLGRMLGRPMPLLVSVERVATLTTMGFVLYSAALYANGAFSAAPVRQHASEVLRIVRQDVDVGPVMTGASWIELRSWRTPGAVERLPLLAHEEGVLWAGKPVLVTVRWGYLSLPWVVSIERDDERHYRHIVERIPTASLAWKHLISLYLLHQRWGRAAEAARRYFELVPDDLDFAANVGGRLGPHNPGPMVIALEPVLGRRPDYFVDVLLGMALGQTGESARGLALIEGAIPLDPENPLAYQALGIVYVGLGRLEDAARVLEAALVRRPGLPEAESELTIVRKKLAMRSAQSANVRMASPQAR